MTKNTKNKQTLNVIILVIVAILLVLFILWFFLLPNAKKSIIDSVKDSTQTNKKANTKLFDKKSEDLILNNDINTELVLGETTALNNKLNCIVYTNNKKVDEATKTIEKDIKDAEKNIDSKIEKSKEYIKEEINNSTDKINENISDVKDAVNAGIVASAVEFAITNLNISTGVNRIDNSVEKIKNLIGKPNKKETIFGDLNDISSKVGTVNENVGKVSNKVTLLSLAVGSANAKLNTISVQLSSISKITNGLNSKLDTMKSEIIAEIQKIDVSGVKTFDASAESTFKEKLKGNDEAKKAAIKWLKDNKYVKAN